MTDKTYEKCDQAVREINRYNLSLFGKLKLAKWDRVNVIRTVREVYEKSLAFVKRKYLGVGLEAYILGLEECGIVGAEATRMARQSVTEKWLDGVLTETDFVTLYRFDTETERKAQRLAETMAAITENEHQVGQPTANRNQEIDRALRAWSGQVGQYAINVTDYATVMAFQDANVDGVFWVSERDGRVCMECHQLDGQWFPIDEIPAKPHWNCRCRLTPGARPSRQHD